MQYINLLLIGRKAAHFTKMQYKAELIQVIDTNYRKVLTIHLKRRDSNPDEIKMAVLGCLTPTPA